MRCVRRTVLQSTWVVLLCAAIFCLPTLNPCWAGEQPAAEAAKEASKEPPAKPQAEKKFPEWDKVIEGAKQLEGLFNLYYNEKEQKLFMEIKQDQFDKEMILPIAIARGAGLMYLGGDTLNFGDQWLISFSRAGDRILVIRRNVRFKAESGSPQADAVKISYTDSVIKAVPVKSEKENGRSVLVDLADLLMTDLAGIGINPDRSRSTWAKVKAFPENIEIEVSAVFSMGSSSYFMFFGDESVPDPRGTQVVVHYGLSMLPSTSYKPRLADDRVGYFLSVLKDFSQDVHETPNIRYTRRWHLEKDKPSADKSPPKKPVIFWIEKTVPRQYRQYVREGILEWNKAFEKVGFIDAIQVRDQQESDDFDPEDIRYNTFRWITTSAGFAMGPSRTNPKTGEILDADIVFDEGMVRYWRQEYIETVGIPEGIELLRHGYRQAFFRLFASQMPSFAKAEPLLNRLLTERPDWASDHARGLSNFPYHTEAGIMRTACPRCLMGPGMQRQLGLLAAVQAAKGTGVPGGKVPEKFIGQAIRHVVTHEVGHTLGLRHNFKASTVLSLEDINDPEITREKGMTGSVMDYQPANIVPEGEKQGDYFSTTIGPWDYWVIEYAYKPISGDETEELAKIASRAPQPELTYGTDEDLFMNPDPRINTFDLGDPLEYAGQRIRLVRAALEDLQNRVVAEGEGWQRARSAFSLLLGELSSATYLAAQYVGGEYTARDHRGDPDSRPPMKPIELAKQREAIKLLEREILSAKAFQFASELLRHLAPDHWRDDYYLFFGPSDYHYPVYQRVLSIQRIVLSRFLDSDVLAALQEFELHADKGEQVLRMPEVFDALTDSIWSELPADGGKKGKLEISTIRRNLQREHVRRLSRMVLGSRPSPVSFEYLLFFDYDRPAPPDARSLARHHLRSIDGRIEKALSNKNLQIDAYSRAHVEEIHDQIAKVLQASLEVNEL